MARSVLESRKDTWERWLYKSLPWRKDGPGTDRPIRLSDGVVLRVGNFSRLWLPNGRIMLPPIRGGAAEFDDANTEFIDQTWVGSSEQPISMAAWAESDANQLQYIVSLQGPSDSEMLLGMNSGPEARCVARDSFFNVDVATSAASLSADTWTHFAARFHSTTGRAVYVNGGSEGTNTASNNPDGLNDIEIGGRRNTSNNWSGGIAEVGIWGADIGTDRIAVLADGFSPLLVSPESLELYAPLIRDNGAGTWRDIVGGLALLGTAPDVSSHPRIFYSVPTRIGVPAGGVGGGLPIAVAVYHQRHHNLAM